MQAIKRYSTNTPWEDSVGYSRGLRVGNVIEVSGTTAANEKGNVIGKGDVYRQSVYIIEKAKTAIEKLGGTIENVTRTRIYVIDISRWEEVGRAHGEFFGKIKPASSMVEVSGLVDPDHLVEMEFTAVIPDKKVTKKK